MMLRTLRPAVACPSCGTLSRRVHSRYLRAIADLPWEGVAVMIRLRTRRFFCADDGCTKRIFVEPLPQTVSRYGRRTCRSRQALDSIAMALGGAAGARLARQLGLLVHRSTLLRVLRQRRSLSVPVTPRVLGIDDWAWRKGRRYGTILCDLERGGVVDLLPDRERTTVENWLRLHPGIEIVSVTVINPLPSRAAGGSTGHSSCRSLASAAKLQRDAKEIRGSLGQCASASGTGQSSRAAACEACHHPTASQGRSRACFAGQESQPGAASCPLSGSHGACASRLFRL